MEEEYLIWKRLEDDCIQQIKISKHIIYMNQLLLPMYKRKIKELERAGKVPKKAPIKHK